MKILIDVPVHTEFFTALERMGNDRIDCVNPLGEKARRLDPERIRDVEILF